MCTTLVRRGCGDPTRLAAELVQRSGLTDLLAIQRHFTERSAVLKARSTLLAVETVLRAELTLTITPNVGNRFIPEVCR